MAGMKRRERAEANLRKADERRELIVDRAADLFAERGYLGTTMAEIADRIGLLGGSLYYYVDSKEELLFEVARGAHYPDYKQWVEHLTDPLDRLRESLRQHIAFNARNASKCQVFYQEFRHLSDERRSSLLEGRRTYEQFLAESVAATQAAGQVKPTYEPRLLVTMLLSSINGIHYWWRSDGALSAEELAEAYVDMLLHGIVHADGTAAAPRSDGGR